MKLDVPSKEHLTLNLSPQADEMLQLMVKIGSESKIPLVTVTYTQGQYMGTVTYTLNDMYGKLFLEAPSIYGVPLKELELFNFVILVSESTYHITPLAFERGKYSEAKGCIKFWMRTTSMQALWVALIGVITLVFTALAFVVSLLNSIKQLLG